MLDLAARHNTPAKPAVRQLSGSLPALSAAQPKPAILLSFLPILANTAALADADLGPSDLPRESSPRIMNPAGVPLTDAARFATTP